MAVILQNRLSPRPGNFSIHESRIGFKMAWGRTCEIACVFVDTPFSRYL